MTYRRRTADAVSRQEQFAGNFETEKKGEGDITERKREGGSGGRTALNCRGKLLRQVFHLYQAALHALAGQTSGEERGGRGAWREREEEGLDQRRA